jgi:AraC-like DNA-binding protein
LNDAPAAPAAPALAIVALTSRERARELLRRSFPRRRTRLQLIRQSAELARALRAGVTDAVIVDLALPGEDLWVAAALARDYPSIPFVALVTLRPSDVASVARACAECEFAECLVEGAEDAAQREVVAPLTFTHRFAHTLESAAPALGLTTPLQQAVWRVVISQGGRTVRTEAISSAVGLTREHLSRRFSAAGAPNLKRVIDLSRLLAASELAKNAGFDLPDIAKVLGFASASHLSASCQRVIGVRSSSLARLRPSDLIDRFVRQGRGRSRTPARG